MNGKPGAQLGVSFEQLRTAVDWSIKQFATPRSKRLEAIRQYVGNHYADGGSEKVVPTNFLELAVMIYTQQLAARAPRATFTAKVPRLKPFAYTTEIAINQIPDEIGLADTLRRAVVEALFAFGVVKVGMASSGVAVLGHDRGQSFADLTSIDNYFCDMSAKTRGGIQFEGDDYWIPVEDARKMYGDGKSSEIEPDKSTVTGDQGEARAEGVSTEEGAELYKDKVWLRDVWLPRNHTLVTYGVTTKKVFKIIEWDGPEGGPYKLLGFTDVPGNLLPLPPVALWRDLHELGNALFRKLGKQADAKKTVAAFSGGNDEDVESLKKAADGEGIRYSGQKPEPIAVGGIDAPTLAFYLQIRDLFSYFAGNLDSMGGLAPMTETIGQDKLLSEAANARIDFMRGRTLDFSREIFKALAWYEWTDPVRERTVEKPVEGADLSVRSTWAPETREGDWLDFNFDIDAYSMQSDAPTAKLQKIGQAIERYIAPLMPNLQQQGGHIDMKELTALIAKLGNIPELNDVIKFGEPPTLMQQEQGSSQPTRAPAHTTRTYERVNRPGATRHGKDDAMSRLLMGSKVQAAEGAAVGRPTS
jgi:hypothetical protein